MWEELILKIIKTPLCSVIFYIKAKIVTSWLFPPIQNQQRDRLPVTRTKRFTVVLSKIVWRQGGLMVSAPDSGSNGPGSSLGRGNALCSWERHFNLIVPLFTQVYTWVPANLRLRVALRWTSIPSRGE